MGFRGDQAVAALAVCGGDVGAATDMCLAAGEALGS